MHGFTDAGQCAVGIQHLGDAVIRLATAVLHRLHGLLGGALQGGDQLVDLLGGIGGALGQQTHLVGHHGEAAAHLAGARGFDGGVQGQQVGLVGDALDHVHHAADLAAVLGQARHGGAGVAGGLRQLFDGAAGLLGDQSTLVGQGLGVAGGLGGLADVAGHLMGSAAEQADRVGDPLGFPQLVLQAAGAVLRQLVGLTGLAGQLFGGVLQAGQAGLQMQMLADHRHFQLRTDAETVGVHAGDQRVGNALASGHGQQAARAAGLPVEAGQAQGDAQ